MNVLEKKANMSLDLEMSCFSHGTQRGWLEDGHLLDKWEAIHHEMEFATCTCTSYNDELTFVLCHELSAKSARLPKVEVDKKTKQKSLWIFYMASWERESLEGLFY